MFQTPERFGAMVREGYPVVNRPASVRFAELVERDGHRVQNVLMTDGSGTLYVVEYDMVAEDGGWKIDGVQVREAGGVGA